MIRIANGQIVSIVVTVRAERHIAGAAGGAWLSIENEPGKALSALVAEAHMACVVHVLAVGSEVEVASLPVEASIGGFGAPHEFLAIYHHYILSASAGAVGATIAIRAERNASVLSRR